MCLVPGTGCSPTKRWNKLYFPVCTRGPTSHIKASRPKLDEGLLAIWEDPNRRMKTKDKVLAKIISLLIRNGN